MRQFKFEYKWKTSDNRWDCDAESIFYDNP
jgi:hypothetical protein